MIGITKWPDTQFRHLMPLTSAFLLSQPILLGRINLTRPKPISMYFSPTVRKFPNIIEQSPYLAVPELRICPLGDGYVIEEAGEA
jgi:hypothetical protein